MTSCPVGSVSSSLGLKRGGYHCTSHLFIFSLLLLSAVSKYSLYFSHHPSTYFLEMLTSTKHENVTDVVVVVVKEGYYY